MSAQLQIGAPSAMRTILDVRHAAGTLMQSLGARSRSLATTTSSVSLVPNATTFIPIAISVQVTFVTLHAGPTSITPGQWLAKRTKWRKREYRQAYMESAIEQGVAWQIRVNRERRQMSQRDLAHEIGSRQSAISRAEDTTYGRHRLETLVKIAHAFDCALQVRFVPYSTLAKDNDDLSPSALYASSYSEETAHASQAAEKLAASTQYTIGDNS